MIDEIDRKTVTDLLFKEVVRAAESSDARANRYRSISIGTVEAIQEALELIKTGRADRARTRLEQALTAAGNMLKVHS